MWPFRKKTPEEKQRKVMQRARKAARSGFKNLRLVPPEGVPLDMRLASLGERLGAQLTDFLITFFGAILFLILFAFAIGGSSSLLTIVGALTFFMIRVPYYILTELAWNGRTIAKRWLGLRVVSVDGRSLTPHQSVTRNIMKEVEFFAPLTYVLVGSHIHWSLFVIALLWVVILLIVPWRNKHNQRIGDIIANTAVIADPKPVLLRDLTTNNSGERQASDERFAFATSHLDQYGRLELQVLERVLRANPQAEKLSKAKQQKNLAEIVSRICKKIDYPEQIASQDHLEFLESFYRAQRAHLESRKLFGDARDDKFFRDKENAE